MAKVKFLVKDFAVLHIYYKDSKVNELGGLDAMYNKRTAL